MKKWVLIVIIILVIIFLFAAFTTYQATAITKSLKESNVDISKDVESLIAGDCSKLDNIEKTLTDIRSGCMNPALKPFIEQKAEEQGQKNICTEVNNPNNSYLVELEKIKEDCKD